MPPPLRVLLDTNVFDRIAETDESLDRVQRLVRRGAITVFVTHVQEDELARITDSTKSARIASIPRDLIPTSEFAVGTSRLDMACLGEGEALEKIRKGNWAKHTRDALIAATAHADGLVLVTEDGRLRNRASEELDIDVWDWKQLEGELRRLAALSEIH